MIFETNAISVGTDYYFGGPAGMVCLGINNNLCYEMMAVSINPGRENVCCQHTSYLLSNHTELGF